MYSVIGILIIGFFLILFYNWCGDRKKVFFKTLLCIGIVPFICDFIYAVISMKYGFTLFDFQTEYGLKAFFSSFWVSMVFGYIIYIPAALAIIISIVMLVRLNKTSTKKVEKIDED